MKKLAIVAFVLHLFINTAALSQSIYLDTNGVTVRCENARVGESAVLNGVSYTVVDNASIRDHINTGGSASVICTSLVTDMNTLFFNKAGVSGNVGHWDTSRVTDMAGLFGGINEGANTDFDQDISEWDVSKVQNMSGMFLFASSFNRPLDNWDVSSVKDLSQMFEQARSFNQDLSSWNVSNVFSFRSMFKMADSFSGDISTWNTRSMQSAPAMFENAENFNSDIGSWDVRNLSDADNMFSGAFAFNRDLSNWCIQKIPATPSSGWDLLSEERQPAWGCPDAVIQINPSFGPAPLVSELDGRSSSDINGDPLTYLWALPDGTNSTQSSLQLTSYIKGHYAVTLYVSDGVSTDSTTSSIQVTNRIPYGTIDATPETASREIYRLVANIEDPDGDSLSFRWKLPSGAIETADRIRYVLGSSAIERVDLTVSDGTDSLTLTHEFTTISTYNTSLQKSDWNSGHYDMLYDWVGSGGTMKTYPTTGFAYFDYEGDGDLDMFLSSVAWEGDSDYRNGIVLNYGLANGVRQWVWRPDLLEDQQSGFPYAWYRQVIAIDIDNDGDDDFVGGVSFEPEPRVGVFEEYGGLDLWRNDNGFFTYHNIRPYKEGTGAWDHTVTAGDVNGDGYADLVTGISAPRLYINRGDGTFAEPLYPNYAGSADGASLALNLWNQQNELIDLNGDGLADLVSGVVKDHLTSQGQYECFNYPDDYAAHTDIYYASSVAPYFKRCPDVTLKSPLGLNETDWIAWTLSLAWSYSIVDLDNDDDLDIVVLLDTAHQVPSIGAVSKPLPFMAIYSNTGNGEWSSSNSEYFYPNENIHHGLPNPYIKAWDVDGDGKKEILFEQWPGFAAPLNSPSNPESSGGAEYGIYAKYWSDAKYNALKIDDGKYRRVALNPSGNATPIAKITTVSGGDGRPGTYELTAEASVDFEGDEMTYLWDISDTEGNLYTRFSGDGNQDGLPLKRVQGINLVHEFNEPGDYVVVLRVSDAKHAQSGISSSEEIVGVDSIRIVINSGVSVEDHVVPQAFEISSAYPNPFREGINIAYSLNEGGRVELRVYDLLGRLMLNKTREHSGPGFKEEYISGSIMSSGVYWVVISHNGHIRTTPIIRQ